MCSRVGYGLAIKVLAQRPGLDSCAEAGSDSSGAENENEFLFVIELIL
jgi:hypothetical protein